MMRSPKHGWPHEPDEHEPFRFWPFARHTLLLAAIVIGAVLALWLIAIANGEVG